jgi:hypothetical protein
MYRTRMLVVLFIAVTIAAGCGRRQSSRSGPARQLKKSELTAAELKYGIAPIPDPSVTYQPDVIVVGGGADAIRAQSSNGLIWTIDGSAAHAAELVPGKIFFLTGRAVGRVLDVRKEGSNLVVVVGPVDITEVIREAHLSIQVPIDFGEAIAYRAPDFPGTVTQASPIASAERPWNGSSPKVMHVAYDQGSPAGEGQAAPVPDVSNLVHFTMAPFASSSGLGVRATSDGGGLMLGAEASVHVAEPELKVNLDISSGGKVREANVELTGAAGLTMKFTASTDVGRKANVHGRFYPDTDFSLPVTGLGGFPFAVTVRQQFIIKTALGVRNASLSATGDYTFNGSFKVGYSRGTWSVFGPIGFAAKESLLQTMGGVSLGDSGLIMMHQLKVIVGIGAVGFVAGPYFAVNSSVGVTRQSDITMLHCREATVRVSLLGGVGYAIPRPVTDAINFFLSALNISYRVTGDGGLSSKPMTIIESSGKAPPSKACTGKDAEGQGDVGR